VIKSQIEYHNNGEEKVDNQEGRGIVSRAQVLISLLVDEDKVSQLA
jgi:hypothetical protein